MWTPLLAGVVTVSLVQENPGPGTGCLGAPVQLRVLPRLIMRSMVASETCRRVAASCLVTLCIAYPHADRTVYTVSARGDWSVYTGLRIRVEGLLRPLLSGVGYWQSKVGIPHRRSRRMEGALAGNR